MDKPLVLMFVFFSLSLSCVGPIIGSEYPAMPKFVISHRTEGPLLKAERPYEEFCIGYVNVMRIGKKWHMWYLAADRDYRQDGDRYFCYASSEDGLLWTRPDLGLYAYKGNSNNNILLYGPKVRKGGFGGGTVFVDEKAPRDERFKMVFVSDAGGSWPVYGATSPDGLRWTFRPDPIMKMNSDTQTVCIPDDGLYRMYVRMWSKGNYEGHRLIGYSESSKFESFPNPKVILQPEKEDPDDLHFYSPGASKLANSQYVMFLSGYRTREDVVRVYLAFSRDGRHFKRVGRDPVVDLGKAFDSKAIYVAPGAIPGDKPGTYWVYYMGSGTQHEENRVAKVRYAGGIGRFLLTVEDAPRGAATD